MKILDPREKEVNMNKSIIEVKLQDETVGHISLTKDGLCAFEYSDNFLSSGFSISPFELPLKKGVFIARPTPFDGGFGVFDDSLPDGWGLLILDRFLKKQGVDPSSLTLLDRLSLVGSVGRGALEYYPDESFFQNSAFKDFKTLAREAEKILTEEGYEGKGVEDLYKRGGSPGGARPKVFVNHDNRQWLVKFRAYQDPESIGQTEYRYSLLAKKCGVQMPETRLFEEKFFGVERFDRSVGNKKIHTVSIAGLLRADYRIPSIDYSHIFKVVNLLTHDLNEVRKVYRLMVFNYLIGNKDDHAKNFALLHDGERWRFAPAYDLLSGGGINGYRTTSINDKIDPGPSDVIAAGVAAGMKESECRTIFDEMVGPIPALPRGGGG